MAARNQPRRAVSIASISIFFIFIIPSKARLASAPPAASASVSARGVICHERPQRTIRLLLSVSCNLERKGLAVPESRAAVETETRDPHDGKLHGQDIALLAAGIVSGGIVNPGYFTIGKSGGIEARCLVRVFVKPEANRVLWLHIRMLRLLIQSPMIDGIIVQKSTRQRRGLELSTPLISGCCSFGCIFRVGILD